MRLIPRYQLTGTNAATANRGRVNIYVWMLLTVVALVLVVVCVLIVGWALILRRMAQAGIRSWDELEAEDADLHAYR